MIEIPKKEPLNIVPFIDIMLVLLAMVLSISTFIAKGEIEVSLPKSQTAGAPVDWTTLDERIARIPREERIGLRIDKNSRFDHFIQVIDLFKKHRHENFAIATEKEAS